MIDYCVYCARRCSSTVCRFVSCVDCQLSPSTVFIYCQLSPLLFFFAARPLSLPSSSIIIFIRRHHPSSSSTVFSRLLFSTLQSVVSCRYRPPSSFSLRVCRHHSLSWSSSDVHCCPPTMCLHCCHDDGVGTSLVCFRLTPSARCTVRLNVNVA